MCLVFFPDDSLANERDALGAGEAPDSEAVQEAVRRQIERLQERLNGNRLDPVPPRTPTDREVPPRDDRRRRLSTVDLEGDQWRHERRERERQRMNRRGSRSKSESPEREAPMSPWSAIGEIGRPRDYTRAQINRIGVGAALEIKNWEREADRQRDAQLARPGTGRDRA